MPTYTYRCLNCGAQGDAMRAISQRNDVLDCGDCGEPMQRIIGRVNFARSSVKTDYHISPITGKPARHMRDVEQQLHQQNEETGSHLVLSDPTDPAAHGVTDEGMQETHDQQVATGTKERKSTPWLL